MSDASFCDAMKRIKSANAARGFILFELPLVLLILGLMGVVIVAVARYFAGNIAWYWWVSGFLSLPIAALSLGFVIDWIQTIVKGRKPRAD